MHYHKPISTHPDANVSGQLTGLNWDTSMAGSAASILAMRSTWPVTCAASNGLWKGTAVRANTFFCNWRWWYRFGLVEGLVCLSYLLRNMYVV